MPKPNLKATATTTGVPDLREVAKTAEAKRLAERREQNEKQQAAGRRWDKGMRRLFKGIVSTPERHRMLRRVNPEDVS